MENKIIRFELFEVYYFYYDNKLSYFIPIGIQDESGENRIINAIVITLANQVIKGVFRCYIEYGYEIVKEFGLSFSPRYKLKKTIHIGK